MLAYRSFIAGTDVTILHKYKEKGDESELHIIIFDELDAICKQRGSGGAGSTGVGDTVVNQLLSKVRTSRFSLICNSSMYIA